MRPFLALLVLAAPAAALEPAELLVVANANAPDSLAVAAHYAKARGVPAANLVELDLPAGEEIARADYDAKLASPLRKLVKGRQGGIKAILLCYGTPLRVGASTPTAAQVAEGKALPPKLAAARAEAAALQSATPPDPAKLAAARRAVAVLEAAERRCAQSESAAAVDSELMLLMFDAVPLERFVPNPLYWQHAEANPAQAAKALMACRLDGPTPAIAKRLVDDAVATERAGGLAGRAYVDARGIGFDANKPGEAGIGYEGYDESFREAAALLAEAGLAVTLDDKPALFAPESCPDAAIYVGWYALASYSPCAKLKRGAVAWHLASSEAVSLKGGTKLWCPNLLADGAAATLGPVAEPYTVGFPKPAEFVTLLLQGELTILEVHARTQLLASWMTTLVADPLYRPFGQSKPGAKLRLKASPAGLGSVFR